MKTTIDMAREAGFCDETDGCVYVADAYGTGDCTKELKAFEALVRADEAEKYKWDVHSCGPICTRVACVALREAVQSEREACAKLAATTVCDTHIPTGMKIYGTVAAKAIRDRGQA
jgi:hypothetical protein